MESELVAAMRRSYELGGLTESDLAADWPTQFGRWFADAVAAGLTEPNAMVLGTAAPDGRPSARTVLLKGWDDRGFVLFTNYGSRKGRESAANAYASLVFPWIDLQRQVVVAGSVAPVPVAESEIYFRSRPRGSRLGAWASPQSEPVTRAELDAARAAVDERWPEPTEIPRPPHWGGLRVSPDSVEFWQGRPDRLHDRLRFRRDGAGGWTVERLAP